MKKFRVSIQADRYPTDYSVEATNWATAIARAIRKWQKQFKGSRTKVLKINAVKSILTDK